MGARQRLRRTAAGGLPCGTKPLLFHTGKFHHLGDNFDPVPWEGSADAPSGMSWFSSVFVDQQSGLS